MRTAKRVPPSALAGCQWHAMSKGYELAAARWRLFFPLAWPGALPAPFLATNCGLASGCVRENRAKLGDDFGLFGGEVLRLVRIGFVVVEFEDRRLGARRRASSIRPGGSARCGRRGRAACRGDRRGRCASFGRRSGSLSTGGEACAVEAVGQSAGRRVRRAWDRCRPIRRARRRCAPAADVRERRR